MSPREVLEAFEQDAGLVSPLLLWSIFFAALNVGEITEIGNPDFTDALELVHRQRSAQIASTATSKVVEGTVLSKRKG